MKKNHLEKIEEALKEGHRLESRYAGPMPDDKWYNSVMIRVRAAHDAKADALQQFIWPFAVASSACALLIALYALLSSSGSGYSVFGVFIDDPSGISALQFFL